MSHSNYDRRDFFKDSQNKLAEIAGQGFGMKKFFKDLVSGYLAEPVVQSTKMVLRTGDPINSQGVGLGENITCLEVVNVSDKRTLLVLGHAPKCISGALVTVLEFQDQVHVPRGDANFILKSGEDCPIELGEGFKVDAALAAARFCVATPWNSVLVFEKWCVEVFPDRLFGIRRGVLGEVSEVKSAALVCEPGKPVQLILDAKRCFQSESLFSSLDQSKNRETFRRGTWQDLSPSESSPVENPLCRGNFSVQLLPSDAASLGGAVVQAIYQNVFSKPVPAQEHTSDL